MSDEDMGRIFQSPKRQKPEEKKKSSSYCLPESPPSDLWIPAAAHFMPDDSTNRIS